MHCKNLKWLEQVRTQTTPTVHPLAYLGPNVDLGSPIQWQALLSTLFEERVWAHMTVLASAEELELAVCARSLHWLLVLLSRKLVEYFWNSMWDMLNNSWGHWPLWRATGASRISVSVSFTTNVPALHRISFAQSSLVYKEFRLSTFAFWRLQLSQAPIFLICL